MYKLNKAPVVVPQSVLFTVVDFIIINIIINNNIGKKKQKDTQ